MNANLNGDPMSAAVPVTGGATAQVSDLLARHKPGFTLPGPMYGGQAAHAVDLQHIWHQEWVFAGHECEVATTGAFITLTVGDYPIVVIRGEDGQVRALHNVCRHRGATICNTAAGRTRRKLVCPYHQWTYDLDGGFFRAGARTDISTQGLDLGRAHCEVVAGLIFVSVAKDPAPIEPLRQCIEPYLAPFALGSAKIAAESVIEEAGNWKLVMENNRECYHCAGSHPELSRTFPLAPLHSGNASSEQARPTRELVAACERAGLPSAFAASPDWQYRIMRMALDGGARSMTLDGAPAVNRRFSGLPQSVEELPDVGDVLLYHYPSMWSHFQGDHVLTFRMLPTGAKTTQLRTTWLVPADAEARVDYDPQRLTEVWDATNAQDAALVALAQRGVASPAFVSGPYAPIEEVGVEQFVSWYAQVLAARLGAVTESDRP